MLFEGVDKNVSTLSTTPNPSGSLFFPWSNAGSNNSSTAPPPKAKKQQQSYPQLSHYSSVPHFPQIHRHGPKGECLLSSYLNPQTSWLKEYLPRNVARQVQETLVASAPKTETGSPLAQTHEAEKAEEVQNPSSIVKEEVVEEQEEPITLNIPEMNPVPVEATNALNLINEGKQEIQAPPPITSQKS